MACLGLPCCCCVCHTLQDAGGGCTRGLRPRTRERLASQPAAWSRALPRPHAHAALVKATSIGELLSWQRPKRNEVSSTEFHARAGPAAASSSISPQLEQMANPFALLRPPPPLPPTQSLSPLTPCYGASGLSAHLSKKHSELLHPRDT